jgi:hypothetical protein
MCAPSLETLGKESLPNVASRPVGHSADARKSRRGTVLLQSVTLAVRTGQGSLEHETRVDFDTALRVVRDLRHAASYIGAVVPSDHMPVSIRNTSIGSGLPLNNGASKSGDPGNVSDSLLEESTRFAPHTAPSMSGV